MTRHELLNFLRERKYGVQASSAPAGAPQSAVVGYVVNDALEMFFDTNEGSRKCANLRRNPAISFVVGWDDGRTVQIEGIADEPSGAALAAWKELYFRTFPDGRARETWPDIVYFRVRPTWIRVSDFRGAAPVVTQVPTE